MVGSGARKCAEGQIIMRLVDWVKMFGLNPEGSGILSRNLRVSVEFQELILTVQWRKGWSQARLSVDERMKDFGALHLGRIGGEQAERYWCFIGRYLCLNKQVVVLLLQAHQLSQQLKDQYQQKMHWKKKVTRNAHGDLNVGWDDTPLIATEIPAPFWDPAVGTSSVYLQKHQFNNFTSSQWQCVLVSQTLHTCSLKSNLHCKVERVNIHLCGNKTYQNLFWTK